MEGVASAIEAGAGAIERVGVADVVLVLLVVIAAIYFWRNNPAKAGASVKETVASAVTPVTCSFGDKSNYQIDKLVSDLANVRDDISDIKHDISDIKNRSN